MWIAFKKKSTMLKSTLSCQAQTKDQLLYLSVDALHQWRHTAASIIHLALINIRTIVSIASVSYNTEILAFLLLLMHDNMLHHTFPLIR
jgi:hypothetical protein